MMSSHRVVEIDEISDWLRQLREAQKLAKELKTPTIKVKGLQRRLRELENQIAIWK